MFIYSLSLSIDLQRYIHIQIIAALFSNVFFFGVFAYIGIIFLVRKDSEDSFVTLGGMFLLIYV